MRTIGQYYADKTFFFNDYLLPIYDLFMYIVLSYNHRFKKRLLTYMNVLAITIFTIELGYTYTGYSVYWLNENAYDF
jgi:hypothetical protein